MQLPQPRYARGTDKVICRGRFSLKGRHKQQSKLKDRQAGRGQEEKFAVPQGDPAFF